MIQSNRSTKTQRWRTCWHKTPLLEEIKTSIQESWMNSTSKTSSKLKVAWFSDNLPLMMINITNHKTKTPPQTHTQTTSARKRDPKTVWILKKRWPYERRQKAMPIDRLHMKRLVVPIFDLIRWAEMNTRRSIQCLKGWSIYKPHSKEQMPRKQNKLRFQSWMRKKFNWMGLTETWTCRLLP